MDNSIVLNEISYWDSRLSSLSASDTRLYELAFFKIFVKFEIFLTQLFIHYCIGQPSNKGYTPNRKLKFSDEKHLEGILKNSKSAFIDYSEKIQSLSQHIFTDANNPFDLVFLDVNLSTYYNQMKIMRNYIAHESNESKSRYHKNVLGQTNTFIEPCDYLSKINRRYSKTYYTIYIECIKEMSDILLDPRPYFVSTTNNTSAPYAAVTDSVSEN